MKLATRKNEFHTNQVQEHIGYRVANTVHLMEILSGLYKDPLAAAIRELSTNAADAHIEAGTPNRPFKVTLPTEDNPTLVIRDFGPGLSKDKMRDVYTVYGVSDKSDSNEGTGCFGLGSKSPFTYCDMFTTISYHQGMEYIGINAVNERGRPTFNIMSESPTNEPDGLEVSFEIKQDDIRRCIQKAVEVYRWFTVLPDCNDSRLLELVNDKATSRNSQIAFEDPDNNWTIFRRKNYSSVTSLAIMGNIAYELDAQQFSGNVKELINNGVEIKVNIGDLDIAPSRDGLKYTRHTIAVLNEKLNKILVYMKGNIEKDIASCKFEWDARAKFIELTHGDLERIYNIVAPKVSFNGNEISSAAYLNDTDGVELERFLRFNRNYNGTISRKEKQVISIRENTIIVVNDSTGKGHAQVRREIAAKNNNNKKYYLYNADSTKAEAVKYITEKLGYDPSKIVYTSSFPKPVKTTTLSLNGKTVRPTDELQCQQLTDSVYGYGNKNYWKSNTVKIDSGTYYYVILNKDFTISTPCGNNWGSNELYKFTTYYGMKVEVIGLTPKRAEKIKGKTNWKQFDVFVKNYLDKWHSNPDNVKGAAINQGRDVFKRWENLKPFLNTNTLMFRFLSTFNNVPTSKTMEDIDNLITLYDRYYGTAYVRPSSKYTFNTDEIEKKYPMLSVVDDAKIGGRYYVKADKKDLKTVCNYINSIG